MPLTLTVKELWISVSPAVHKSAYDVLRCCRLADDITSDICWYLMNHDCNKNDGNPVSWPWNNINHAKAFLKNKATWAARDYQRRRNRHIDIELINIQTDINNTEDDKNCVLDVMAGLGPDFVNIVNLLMKGYTQTEVAQKMKVSKATICRCFDIVKQKCRFERLLDEQQNQPKENVMEANHQVRITKNVAEVLVEGEVVAVGTIYRGGLTNVVLKKQGIDGKAMAEIIVSYMKSEKSKEQPKENQGMPKKTSKNDNPKNVRAKGRKVKEGTKEQKGNTTKSKKPVGEVVEFPATMAEWVSKCGGKGKCLEGCGANVKSRFLPGHDAILKGMLKRSGSDNAKAIAKELGWFGIIKW